MVSTPTVARTAAALVGLALLLPAPAHAQEVKGKLTIGHHKVKLQKGKIYQVIVTGSDGLVPIVDIPVGHLHVVLGTEPKLDKTFCSPDRNAEYEFFVFPPSFGFPKNGAIDYTLKITPVELSEKPILEDKNKWDTSDPIYKIEKDTKDSHFKPYKLQMKAGQIYVINLAKGEEKKGDDKIDPYLYLEGPDGKLVSQDDDSGGDLNARIIYSPLRDGEYRIIATTLQRATGPYTLTVHTVKE